MTDLADLIEFLRACIAEDEAQRVTRFRTGPSPTPRELREAARWEAECEAKRRIVEGWREAEAAANGIRETFEDDDSPRARVERASYNATAHAWWGAMELAALPYADRPGYREEWRP